MLRDPIPPATTAPLHGSLVVLRDLPGGRHRFVNARAPSLRLALMGQAVGGLPERIGRLVPVCRWAQGIACARALEAASGTPALAATEAARERLLSAEAAVAVLWRHDLEWPELSGARPFPGRIRAARQALESLVVDLWQEGDPLRPGSMATPCRRAGESARSSARLLDEATAGLPDTAEGVADWVTGSDAGLAAMIRSAMRLVGNAPMAMEHDTRPSLAGIASAVGHDPGFAARPDHDGAACDVGPLSALPPAARAVLRGLGPVGARFGAMLLQMHAAARALVTEPSPRDATSIAGPGWAAGLATTQRGPLVHWLRIDAGQLADFRSVAPTEWLLHPEGDLLACLDALPARASVHDVRLVAAAFDPCAEVVVVSREAAHA